MKMFYTAYTNKGNVGDLLITKYQIEECAKYGDVYVDCHGMPDRFRKVLFDTNSSSIKDFETEYGLSYRSRKLLKVFNVLNKQGFTHFCGSPGPREPLVLPLRRLCLKFLGVFLPAVFLKRKIKRYSLGVDVNYDFKGVLGKLNYWYFSRFDILGIRSQANLSHLTPKMKNVIYIPDMAFLYPDYDASSYEITNKRIGLSFREVEDYEGLLKILNVVCRIARSQNYSIDVIYQVEEDRLLCQKLVDDLSEYDVRFVDKPIDYYSLKSYRNYDMLVSNRLHVLLLAAMNGALPCGLISRSEKEQKIKDIFDGVFGEKYVTYMNEFNVSGFTTFFNSRKILIKEVRQCVEKQRIICTNTFAGLFGNSKK